MEWNRNEKVKKKEAKRMTRYAERLPKWNQHRCQKSIKINKNISNEQTHENYET